MYKTRWKKTMNGSKEREQMKWDNKPNMYWGWTEKIWRMFFNGRGWGMPETWVRSWWSDKKEIFN